MAVDRAKRRESERSTGSKDVERELQSAIKERSRLDDKIQKLEAAIVVKSDLVKDAQVRREDTCTHVHTHAHRPRQGCAGGKPYTLLQTLLVDSTCRLYL